MAQKRQLEDLLLHCIASDSSVEQNMCFHELCSITISITVGQFVTKMLDPLSYYPTTYTVHNEQLYILGFRDLLSRSKELEIVQKRTVS